MLHFVYGRVGSGKTTHVHNLIRDFAKAGREDIMLIVPEQFSFSAERAMLELLGPKDCNRVEVVMSFTHIADAVYKLYGGNKLPVLDDGGKAMVMSMAMDSVTDHLTLFARKKKSGAMIGEMLSLSDELRQSAVSADELYEASKSLEKCVLKDKMQEVSYILSAYDALLENTYFDSSDTLTRLYKTLEEFPFFKDKIVIIDGFHSFTGQEYKIIEQILIQSKVTYVTLCTDSVFNNTEDYGVFSYTKKTAKRLMELAKKHSVPVTKGINLSGVSKFCNFPPKFERYGNTEIGALEKNLYKPDPLISPGETEHITLTAARNIRQECDSIACEIKRLLREGTYRCRDISVVYRSNETYEQEIRSSLRKYGIDVFVDNRQPVYTQPLVCLLKNALAISAEGFRTETVLRYLKTGLTDVTPEEVYKIENYVLMWQISNKAWLHDWTENPSGLGQEMLSRHAEELETINQIRKKTILPLCTLKKAMEDVINGEELGRVLYRFLLNIHADENLKRFALQLEDCGELELALEQERIWDMVMNILDQFAGAAGTQKYSAQKWKTLFDTVVSVQDIGKLPQGLDEVVIGNAQRMRIGSPKVVFAAGVNDGVFPLACSDDGMFSGKDRKRLHALGLNMNDGLEDKLLEERFIAYNTLCSAREKLYVSYADFALNGEEQSASELVTQIQTMFPKVKTVHAQDTADMDWIESEQSAFEIMSAKWRDTDALSASLKQFFVQDKKNKGKLDAIEYALNDKMYEIQSAGLASSLFGKNMYLSASRVEDYFKCPFQYFCKYGVGAKPREPARLDPRQRGTVIHYVLERLIRENSIKGLSALSADRLRDKIKIILAQYAEEKMGGMAHKNPRFVYLYSRFERIVLDLIRRLIDEFSQSSFEPVDFELRIDKDGDIKTYDIKLPDGGKLSVRGSVDRVDKMQDGDTAYIRVVDYKTGGKDFVLSDVLYGLNMQMLIYLFSIWENGAERYGEVVPSGVLYMPSKVNYISGSADTDEETLRREHQKENRLNGLVLGNSVVVLGMEKDGKGVYIPASIDKNGQLKGSLISLSQMGRLRKHVDEILEQMAMELHAGKIPAVPADGGERHYSKCAFCDYSSVCGFEDGGRVRKIEKYKLDDALMILEKGGVADGGYEVDK